MPSLEELKKTACSAIDGAAQDLDKLSQDIWKQPELAYEEHHAHKVLTDFLEGRGFPIERHHVLETAFRAVVDHGDGAGPTAAVLCEYDALPGIGHACGHNLIAEVGAGAAVGIKAAMDAAKDAGQKLGKLHVIGTPAEEGGGGKCRLLDANIFKNVDAALMAHPCNYTATVTDNQLICRLAGKMKFYGKASHAAAFPWEGINALDAAVMAYNNISVLRQQIKPTWRIHTIISNGGAKPNIIPEETEILCNIRCPTKAEMNLLEKKVTRCFDAAAMATGCKVDVEWNSKEVYLNVITNRQLADLFDKNAATAGVQPAPQDNDLKSQQLLASTDMGNVSYEVPSIHPWFYIGSDEAIHTRAFTAATGDPKAQPYAIAQAKALAMTAIDVYLQPELLKIAKEQFTADIAKAAA